MSKSKNPDKPHYIGHRERLRRRFQKTDVEGFHEYELLELLLTYAIPRRDVEPIAKELIKRFGNISGHTEPSEEDKRIMDTIIQATRTIDIRVIDHIIVGKNRYFSFREIQILPA